MYSEQNNTQHTEFAKVPYDVPNTALTNSLRKVPTTANHRITLFQDRVQHHAAQQHCTSRPEPPSLYDGTSPLHSKHRMPIRRPYTTNRPQFTLSHKRQSRTWSSPRFNVCNSADTHSHRSSSCSKCKTQSRVDTLTPGTNQQCAAATRKTALKAKRADDNNAPNTLKRTGSHVPLERSKCSVTSLPLVKSPRFLATIRRRLTPLNNVLPREVSLVTIAHWLRNQLLRVSRQARCSDRNTVREGPRLHSPQARPAICRSRQLAAQSLADVRRYCRLSSRTASVGWNESAPDCVHGSHVEGTRLRTDATRGTISHVHW